MGNRRLIDKAGATTGFVLISSCLLLAACGEISYKRGASAGDLAQAKLECSASSAPAAIEACLETKGWLVADMGKDALLNEADPVIQATYQGDQRTPTVSNKPSEMPKPGGTPTQPKDPMDVFVINSWWKAGQGPQALQADSAACVAELGQAHQPDASYQKATRGLLRCMRKHGWYALQGR